jgi:hypothetical protein
MEQRRVQKEKYGKRAHLRIRNPVPQGVPPAPYIGDVIHCQQVKQMKNKKVR